MKPGVHSAPYICLAKSDANLEVAKRENSVILYEDDYKTRNAGFNPNSAESYIIFEFMQDKYIEQSVHLASLFKNNSAITVNRSAFALLAISARRSSGINTSLLRV